MSFTTAISLLVLSIVLQQGTQTQVVADSRRPFWNIAHMVNAIDQIEPFLKRGANAIEFDIEFDSEGIAQQTHHGVPCDCGRICNRKDDFVKYLDHIRQVTSPGTKEYREQLILLALDLKLQRISVNLAYAAGTDIANKLIDHYWKRGNSTARAYILLNIPSIRHFDFINGFKHTIIRREGYERYDDKYGINFTGNDDLELTRLMLGRMNITYNIWQADGITSCLPRGTRRLKEAIRRRDTEGYKFIYKVYSWTLVAYSTMRRSMRLSVDGIMSNHPERVVYILGEGYFANRFRMATLEDNPWQKYHV
uniref:Loxtox protein n=1 Tax=Loxosceles similis TaxID=321804 RepID=A0A1B2ASA8_LOXSM|nr:loxtox protein [Loxosceles similis]